MAFKTKGQLNDHKNRHSNFRPYKCNFCNASFNRKTRLKVHIMIHTGDNLLFVIILIVEKNLEKEVI